MPFFNVLESTSDFLEKILNCWKYIYEKFSSWKKEKWVNFAFALYV